MAEFRKPDITKGEWSDWFGHVKSGVKSIADCDTELGEEAPETIEANAKAISAVPEMIDALIEYVESKAGPTVAYEKAFEALTKAGCKIDG